MPSIVPNFEYDIFISYRHNDNRSGWVTEFVNALQEELSATIKDPLSIYFDKNPHDGLLETHNVDKSLEGKLKCLIFIPIISQTYCDTKSFAWQHEFVAFNKLAYEASPFSSGEGPGMRLGRDVKLTNGNVASRILPIKIHDLDDADKALIENEIGGVLRPIEFIYRELGVNRPLKPSDSKADNQNKTDYRNQVNKVANAIKELVVAMKAGGTSPIEKKSPNQKQNIAASSRKKISIMAALVIALGILGYSLYYFMGMGNTFFKEPDKSIAVLPFENMNRDSTQDYFSNGIAEDILNHLVKIADLKVKSRTSTLQYKGTKKTVSEIGEELNVGNIVEGTVRRVGDKIRIVVQLIDTETDTHLWSETYDRDMKDVLSLQSEIAIEIAKALEATLTSGEKKNIEKEITHDVTAYDYYLQAREQVNKVSFSKEEFEGVMELINKAITLDPTFSKAYAFKAYLWFQLSSFGLPQKAWEDSVFLNTSKSILHDPQSSDGYLVQAWVHWYLGNLSFAKDNIEMAYRLNPNDLDVQQNYGYELLKDGDERGADMVLKSIERNYSTKQTEYYQSFLGPLTAIEDYGGAIKMVNEAIKLNPKSDNNYYRLGALYRWTKQYDEAQKTYERLLMNSPEFQGAIDELGWIHFLKKDYKQAVEYWSKYKEIEARFEDKTQTVPFRHRLAMALLKLGEDKKAKDLLLEDLSIQTQMLEKSRSVGTWGSKGNIYYDLAVDNTLLGKHQEGVQYLDSAFKYGFRVKNFYEYDPAFEKVKDLPQFRKVQGKVDEYFAFRKKAFTNALNRAKASKELKGVMEK